MKALTLEILGGGFLPPNAFALLLKAICIIAGKQEVKHLLKTQLGFCRLILNRRNARSPECTKNSCHDMEHCGSDWLWWDSPHGREWLCAVLSKGQMKHNTCTSNLCEKHAFSAAFTLLSTLICMRSQSVHPSSKACIHPAEQRQPSHICPLLQGRGEALPELSDLQINWLPLWGVSFLSVDYTGTKACLAGSVKCLQLSGVILISTLQSLVKLAANRAIYFSYSKFQESFSQPECKAKPSTLTLHWHWELKQEPEMVLLLQAELVWPNADWTEMNSERLSFTPHYKWAGTNSSGIVICN